MAFLGKECLGPDRYLKVEKTENPHTKESSRTDFAGEQVVTTKIFQRWLPVILWYLYSNLESFSDCFIRVDLA